MLIARFAHLIMLIAIVAAAMVFQAGTAEPAGAQPGCGSIPLVSAACDLATDPYEWAWDTTTGVAGDIAAGAFDYFATWLATAAVASLGLLWTATEATSSPDLGATGSVWAVTYLAARAMALPLVVVAGLWSILRRDPELIVKALFVYLPGSVVAMAAAAVLTQAALDATDSFSDAMIIEGENGVEAWFDGLGGTIAAGTGITSPALLGVFSAVLLIAAVFVWIVMEVRAAAILITFAFMPLSFIGLLIPPTRHWMRRTVETLVAFILSKMVIVASFALAANVLADSDNAAGAMIQASAIFFLAGFSPFALMRLLPLVSNEAVAATEAPARAPGHALRTAAAIGGGAMLNQALSGASTPAPGAPPPAAGTGGAQTGWSGGGTSPVWHQPSLLTPTTPTAPSNTGTGSSPGAASPPNASAPAEGDGST